MLSPSRVSMSALRMSGAAISAWSSAPSSSARPGPPSARCTGTPVAARRTSAAARSRAPRVERRDVLEVVAVAERRQVPGAHLAGARRHPWRASAADRARRRRSRRCAPIPPGCAGAVDGGHRQHAGERASTATGACAPAGGRSSARITSTRPCRPSAGAPAAANTAEARGPFAAMSTRAGRRPRAAPSQPGCRPAAPAGSIPSWRCGPTECRRATPPRRSSGLFKVEAGSRRVDARSVVEYVES